MKAQVALEALPGRVVEGIVDTISTMPLSDQRSSRPMSIAYYRGPDQAQKLAAGASA